MSKDDVKSEFAHLEYEDYEKSCSEDDFKTWKLKKYINSRFYLAIAIPIGLIIGLLIALR